MLNFSLIFKQSASVDTLKLSVCAYRFNAMEDKEK